MSDLQDQTEDGTPSLLARACLASLGGAPADVPGYQLHTLIGRGSFGEVWSGRQTGSGQRVAVKMLSQGKGLDWSYFAHEVAILRELAHPHVVHLLDADLEHNPPYLVMPLLARGSLAEERNWDGKSCTLWFEQMALALTYAHQKGIIHCDLKPSNVLLDEQGAACLTDFGQARRRGDSLNAYGTLGYMAPEQASGATYPDVGWDLYALGATVYFLLTGKCPRLTPDDLDCLAQCQGTGERLHLYQELISLRPLVPLPAIRPDVDAAFAAIVDSCLSPEPHRRPASAADLLSDLRRRRRGSPLLCLRPWTPRYRINCLLGKPLVALSFFLLLLFPLLVNAYVSVKDLSFLYAEVVQRLRDVNGLARRQIETSPQTAVRSLASSEFRHYLVESDGRVVQAFNDPTPPARLDLATMAAQADDPEAGVYRDSRGHESMGTWGRVGQRSLVTEADAAKCLDRVQRIRQRSVLLSFLTVAVSGLLAVMAFRITGEGDEPG